MRNLDTEKESKLKKILQDTGKLAIAYSGGYDSSFLAKIAEKILGSENVLLIHVKSVFSPLRDEIAVANFAKCARVRIINISVNPLANEKIVKNSRRRCYHCKKVIMKLVTEKGKSLGFAKFADGTNFDDLFEERPGFKASNELRIMHPLLDAGLRKGDMVAISEKYGFDLSFSPSSACLATRIPFGTRLSVKALRMADGAENILCGFRITSPRVRVYGEAAVIEIFPELFEVVLKNREEIVSKIKGLGFKKVFLDLLGYKKNLKAV